MFVVERENHTAIQVYNIKLKFFGKESLYTWFSMLAQTKQHMLSDSWL